MQLLCGGAAEPFLDRLVIAGLLPLLPDVTQLTTGKLTAQLQQFWNTDVDMHIVRLPLAGWLIHIVGSECKMGLTFSKSIGQALYKAVLGILADDLALITLLLHCGSTPSGEEYPQACG